MRRRTRRRLWVGWFCVNLLFFPASAGAQSVCGGSCGGGGGGGLNWWMLLLPLASLVMSDGCASTQQSTNDLT